MNPSEHLNKKPNKIQQGSYFEIFSTETSSFTVSLPVAFDQMCKGNLNNAKVLLLSIVREILYDNNVFLCLAYEHENATFPISVTGTGDFKSGAKDLLSSIRDVIGNQDKINYCDPRSLIVASNKPIKTHTIELIISNDIKSLTFNFFNELETFSALLSRIIILNTNNSKIDEDLNDQFRKEIKIVNSIVQSSTESRKKIIEKSWTEVFQQSLQWDKNYYSNGGDSIQAIRFISKIKSSGWLADFGELLNSPSMSEWIVKPSLSETENVDIDSQNSYPLSAMQQKIWNQSVASGKGIYHEQFLFELNKQPNVSDIKKAFTIIWNRFSQFRIKIEESNHAWKQTVINIDPDFRILENEINPDYVLKNDVDEAFSNQLMRCIYFTFQNKSYLLWSHHHVLLDGWSVGLLIQQFIRLLDGEEIIQQNINYQHLLVKKEKEFLSKKLKNNWESFFNTHEAQRFNSKSKNSYKFNHIIKDKRFSNLNEFCKLNDCTPQHVFLSAFSIVNFALTGKSSSYIHSISSGRSIIPEYAETAIGLFIKNIILGWTWMPTQSIKEIIASVKQGQQFALSNEHYNYQDINEFHNEIPDALFVYENYPYDKVEGKNISGKLIYNQELTGYPFTLLIMPYDDKIQLKAIYDNGLFNSEFVSYILDRIATCVEEIILNSEKSLEYLFLSEEKNIISNHFPDWTAIIENQLLQNPDQKIINGFNNNFISFHEVIELTDKLCFVLNNLNKKSRVALYGIKNEYTPALIYAIMKCGFTYVPINPSWPKDRIDQVLQISDCKAIIFPEDKNDVYDFTVSNINLSKILSSEKKKNKEPIEITSEAYILFTSGSTGEPKGVKLTHVNLSSFLDACKSEIDLTVFDYLFSITNLGFDLSLFENLFGMYSNKPTVMIPEIENIETCLTNYPGGLLNTVPSVINKLQPNEINSLKVVHTAGEPFTEKHWLQLKQHNPDLKIINWYGPTETTTYSTCIDLTTSYSPAVGKSLIHEQVSVRDYLLCKLPEGIEGEIVIEGKGVANGYINSDQGGFVTKNNEQFYKTGDRGFFNNDILYLKGRNDRQVKRLGQRFELGEVEQEIMRSFNQIKRTIYIHHEGKFILFVEASDLTETSIEANLIQKFPAYMRPDKIIIMNIFPENANGKINSKILVEKHIQFFKEEYTGENNLEILKKLRQLSLFSSLNGNYGFIEQGGDSILGLRLIGKLKNWGYKAEINKLLNAVTLNDFIKDLSISDVVNSVSNKIELTPIQQWFLKNYSGNKNHYNQSVLLEVLLPIDVSILVNAIHQTLLNFKLLSKVYSDSWQDGLAPSTEYYYCNSEDEVTEKCSVIQQSFNLKTGPVAGSAVFELPNKKLFFISIHHFYCDGYSWRLILDELQQVLHANGNEHHSNYVFGKLHQHFIDLGNENKLSDLKYYGETISNPFKNWTPVDYENSLYTEWEWSETETQWFQFNDVIGKSINEKFLYLFLRSWQSLNLPDSSYFFETHGRSYNGIPEITESIGWFTQFYPVFTNKIPSKDSLLLDIANEFKSLPNNGLTYMFMENWQQPPFPVLLNFLGNFDEENSSIVRSSKINQGKMTDDKNPMLSYVELNAMIFEGKLKWMLRSHPDFNSTEFKNIFNSLTNEIINQGNSVAIVSGEIDQDDIDTISDLMKDL